MAGRISGRKERWLVLVVGEAVPVGGLDGAWYGVREPVMHLRRDHGCGCFGLAFSGGCIRRRYVFGRPMGARSRRDGELWLMSKNNSF